MPFQSQFHACVSQVGFDVTCLCWLFWKVNAIYVGGMGKAIFVEIQFVVLLNVDL